MRKEHATSQAELQELQRIIQDQGHGWQTGPASLSGLPPGEQARRLGLRLVPEAMERIAVTMAEEPPSAPSSRLPGTGAT
jgi:hypothetical protein